MMSDYIRTSANLTLDIYEVLRYLLDYKRLNDGDCPSLREIVFNCPTCSSSSQAAKALGQLVESGELEKTPNGRSYRAPTRGRWYSRRDLEENLVFYLKKPEAMS